MFPSFIGINGLSYGFTILLVFFVSYSFGVGSNTFSGLFTGGFSFGCSLLLYSTLSAVIYGWLIFIYLGNKYPDNTNPKVLPIVIPDNIFGAYLFNCANIL